MKAKIIIYMILAIIPISLVICSGFTENNIESPDSTATDSIIPESAKNNREFIYEYATVENIEIVMLESFPVQVHVIAKGYLPDSCTRIDSITQKRNNTAFSVTITTIRPKDKVCAQMIQPFEERILLDVYGLEAGLYSVVVNGVKGSFELAVDNVFCRNPHRWE